MIKNKKRINNAMKTFELIVQVLFFTVNTFAVAYISLTVLHCIKHINEKLDYTLKQMEYLRERTRRPYLWMLIYMRDVLVSQEKYEDAAKLKELIKKEIREMEAEEESNKDKKMS